MNRQFDIFFGISVLNKNTIVATPVCLRGFFKWDIDYKITRFYNVHILYWRQNKCVYNCKFWYRLERSYIYFVFLSKKIKFRKEIIL